MENTEKIDIIHQVFTGILDGDMDHAKAALSAYPFQAVEYEKRSYTNKTKMEQFVKDGFIDRYSGEKLLNPGVLRVISCVLPAQFPFQAHWKMSECHTAYWELTPTIDHIVPIARGGEDRPENWATTSMMHNLIKSNWTMEQMQWKLHRAGNLEVWDGMTRDFVMLIEKNPQLKEVGFIAEWYRLSREYV